MEVQEVAVKRRGNPNFGKRKSAEDSQDTNVPDLNKQYVFQLIKTHEKQKPRDGKTGELVGSPYQPFYAVVNSGLAWDDTYTPKGASKPGAQRRWRYLHNFPTIWVDEQVDPEPTAEDLNSNMNDLIFRYGVLRVYGHETLKLQSLMLNNTFSGCKRPLKNIPKEFELLDQDKIDKEVLETLDNAFEAEKLAREMSNEDMYSLCYYYGIDTTKSDAAIRNELIGQARGNPKVFCRECVNPKNKYKYAFLSAFADNYISTNIIEGCVCYVDSKAKICDLHTSDAAEELANNAFSGDVKAKNLYEKIEKMYQEE